MKTKYAFFDVDETLITKKSMLDFLEFWFHQTNKIALFGRLKYKYFLHHFKKLNNFASRDIVNRFYYKIYAGVSEKTVERLGQKWWKHKLESGNIFNSTVLEELIRHRNNDLTVVLVSGSMKFCIEPILKHLKLKHGIWTELKIENGKFTGDVIGMPNVGQNKVNHIKKFLQSQKSDADLENSYAYGDHDSDLPMLHLVGNSFLIHNNNIMHVNIDSIY